MRDTPFLAPASTNEVIGDGGEDRGAGAPGRSSRHTFALPGLLVGTG